MLPPGLFSDVRSAGIKKSVEQAAAAVVAGKGVKGK